MDNKEIASYIVKRYDRLYGDQGSWRSIWQDLADYIHVRKSNVLEQREPGAKQTEKLYDSTAIHSNELLAASMNGALTSAAVRWLSLHIRGIYDRDKELTDWLEDCAERMYRSLQQSNFNSEIHESYLDLGAFGTAALEITERDIEIPGFNGLQFKSYSIGEYVVDEDSEGRVNRIIRKFKMPLKAAVDKWGLLLDEKIIKRAKDQPDEDMEFLHGILPYSELGMKKNIHPFISAYIDYKTKVLITQRGFREFPVAVVRWAKSSGEKYGRGPGFTALPDIKTLNKVVELTLKADAKAIDPPLEVLDQGVIGNVKLQPSGINWVTTMGNIKPIDFGAKFDVGKIEKEDLRTSIRRIFFSDQLQFQETPQMTATEVYVRYELMQRLLGPTLGRLESELLNPLVERVFGLMFRAGAFAPPPPTILRYPEIDIEYEGSMARAQRANEIVAIQRTLQIVAPFAEVKPQILDWYDEDKLAKFAPEITGMPSSLLRSDDEVAALREERQKQQEELQKLQSLSTIAEGAGKAAPLVQTLNELGKGKAEGTI